MFIIFLHLRSLVTNKIWLRVKPRWTFCSILLSPRIQKICVDAMACDFSWSQSDENICFQTLKGYFYVTGDGTIFSFHFMANSILFQKKSKTWPRTLHSGWCRIWISLPSFKLNFLSLYLTKLSYQGEFWIALDLRIPKLLLILRFDAIITEKTA